MDDRAILVYGIETSCDDTGLALLEISPEGRPTIVSELVSSQVTIHKEYGGIVPELASRAHLQNLRPLHDELFQQSGRTVEEVDCIAVTSGPGLKGCLLMGVSFASGIFARHEIPVYGVNHIEGHLLSPMMDNEELCFPYLCLVVSGGHTEIHRVEGVGQYELLARTIDDAAGEAFDKSAHLLGFEYPGGPALAKLADATPFSGYTLPIPMKGKEGFSFSGLKTAISLLIKKVQAGRTEVNDQERAEIAFAVQDAIVKSLMMKVKGAMKRSGLTTVAVAGGVSANNRLRKDMAGLRGSKVYFAKMNHCVDNGAMIAYAAGLRAIAGEAGWERPSVQARWPVETMSRPANGASA